MDQFCPILKKAVNKYLQLFDLTPPLSLGYKKDSPEYLQHIANTIKPFLSWSYLHVPDVSFTLLSFCSY
jgi:hypothetical protein